MSTRADEQSERGSAKRSTNLSGMFEFFARLVKLTILRKDDTDVISKYSTWLRAVRNHADAELKCDYAKLLLMGLHHGEPVCPFNDYPPATIDPVDGGDWKEKARSIFRGDDPSCRPTVLNPPIVTAVSDSKRQFAAYQLIPNAGMQCFYARSDEPLEHWRFKFDSLSRAPDHAPHAISLDWERSLAGIRRKRTAHVNEVTFKKDPCDILRTSQENIGVVETFKWYENSLLTGDTIHGSLLCVDWMIHEHENTQLDMDDDIIRSYDKMFPGNFCVSANPEFLEGILKKLECTNKNFEVMDFECAKMFPCLPSRQCAGNDQSRLLSKPSVKPPNSGSNLISTVHYEQKSTDGLLSSFSLMTQLKNDDTMLSNKYKNPFKDYHVPQTITELSRDDKKKFSDVPSFMRASRSFNSIAHKAEDTLKKVKNWLECKKRR